MVSKKLSVIIPVFNVEKYIKECIHSIQIQEYENLEIIIVDDGSSDQSGEICDDLRKHDARIRIFHQKNQGVMAARIRGIIEATGEMIGFVDGDDYIKQDMYSNMLAEMQHADMITCAIERDEKQYRRIVSDDFEEGIYTKDALVDLLGKAIYDFESEKMQRFIPVLWNKVYITRIMKEVALELNGNNIAYAEDFVMLYHYMLKCKSIFISKNPHYIYRYRENSAMHGKRDTILIDINRAYLSLKHAFCGTEDRMKLEYQLQKWTVCVTAYAFNNQMAFDNNICPMEFLLDGEVLRSNRIAIYGAGKCGRDYYKQLERNKRKPVIWVDKNFVEYRKQHIPVDSPELVEKEDFDILLIAISREDMAKEIIDELESKGIRKDKLFWKKPVRVF